jgi:hypothetical protein
MAVSEEIRELILRRAATDEISRAAKKQGMDCLRDDGLLKAAQGVITVKEVLRTVVQLRPNARELRALVVQYTGEVLPLLRRDRVADVRLVGLPLWCAGRAREGM